MSWSKLNGDSNSKSNNKNDFGSNDKDYDMNYATNNFDYYDNSNDFQNNRYPKNFVNPNSVKSNSKYDDFDSISYDDNENENDEGRDTGYDNGGYNDPNLTDPFFSYPSSFNDASVANNDNYFSSSYNTNNRQKIINTVPSSYDQNKPKGPPTNTAGGGYDWKNIPNDNFNTYNDKRIENSYPLPSDNAGQSMDRDGMFNTGQSQYDRNNNYYVPSSSSIQNQRQMPTNDYDDRNDDWMKASDGIVNSDSIIKSKDDPYYDYSNINYDVKDRSRKNQISDENDKILEISYDVEDSRNKNFNPTSDVSDDYKNYDWRQISAYDLAPNDFSLSGSQQWEDQAVGNMDSKKFDPSTKNYLQKDIDIDNSNKVRTMFTNSNNGVEKGSNSIMSSNNDVVIYQTQDVSNDAKIDNSFDNNYLATPTKSKYDVPKISNVNKNDNKFVQYDGRQSQSYYPDHKETSYRSQGSADPVGPIFEDYDMYSDSNKIDAYGNREISQRPPNIKVRTNPSKHHNEVKDGKRNTKYDEFDAIPMYDDMEEEGYNVKTDSNIDDMPAFDVNDIFNPPINNRGPYNNPKIFNAKGHSFKNQGQSNIPNNIGRNHVSQKGSNVYNITYFVKNSFKITSYLYATQKLFLIKLKIIF